MNLNNYFNNNMLKIYPYDEKLENMGFYLLIHESTRVINNNNLYQCTLFLNETPYCHTFESLLAIENSIQNNKYKIENGNIYSEICDIEIMELTEIKEIPNNEKIEDIHKLVSRYNDRLELIENEKQYLLIKALFHEYINSDKYTLEQVENILKDLLR